MFFHLCGLVYFQFKIKIKIYVDGQFKFLNWPLVRVCVNLYGFYVTPSLTYKYRSDEGPSPLRWGQKKQQIFNKSIDHGWCFANEVVVLLILETFAGTLPLQQCWHWNGFITPANSCSMNNSRNLVKWIASNSEEHSWSLVTKHKLLVKDMRSTESVKSRLSNYVTSCLQFGVSLFQIHHKLSVAHSYILLKKSE